MILGSEQVLVEPVGFKLSHQQVESEMLKLLLFVVTPRTVLTVCVASRLPLTSVRKVVASSVLMAMRQVSVALWLL